MLFNGLLATNMSGKLDGLVASHNAGGSYLRQLVTPTNPNTPFQQAVRGFMSTLTSGWLDILTPAQRDEWDVYADNVKLTNRIGAQVNISGLAQYVRSNVPRLQAGLARIDDGPKIFNLGTSSNPSFTNATALGQTIDVTFGTALPADTWTVDDGAGMLVYTSRPQNASVKFFKGPYRFATVILGAVIPPISPVAVNAQFPFAEGQNVFLRSVVSQADGRLGGDFRDGTLAVA